MTNYVDGILHGEYAQYTEKGALLEQGRYNYGDLEGDYRIWNAAGKLLVTCTYTDGSMISMH